MNANDARISRLYVTNTGGDVQEAAPNAPNGGPPATNFDLTLEMEQGLAVAGGYTLVINCYDVTAGDNNAAMAPPTGPLNGPGNFAVAPWVAQPGGDQTFDQTVTIAVPTGVQRHVFYYTMALVSNNNQIIDIKDSEPFILV